MILPDPLALEVLQGQFGHLAGPHQQHVFAGQVAEDLLGQADRGVADADGVVADAGFGAHPFGHGEGLVEQPVEDGAGGLMLRGLPVGLLHLAQDLGFAHHHGVQAGGHPEDVAHRLRSLVHVEGRRQVVRGDLRVAERKVADQASPACLRRRDAEHLHPVAGGVEQDFREFRGSPCRRR